VTIQPSEELWACAPRDELPAWPSDPGRGTTFVLVRADVCERFKSLFKEHPVSERRPLLELQQLEKLGDWDELEMNIDDELDPRCQDYLKAILDLH